MRKLLLVTVTLTCFSISATEVDCDGVCATQELKNISAPFLKNISNIVRYSEKPVNPDQIEGDTRKVRSSSSPEWLAAIGRLVSKTGNKTKEQCSLTVISDSPDKDGIIAITAGHCVDHWRNSSDGSYSPRDNEVTFTANDNTIVKRSIAHVYKAAMNDGDYAIVKLNKSISKDIIKPLINAPYKYTSLQNDEDFQEEFKPFATMAGYSADTGLGQKGKVLTYDEEDCHLNGGASGMKKGYCHAYAGASGGPVVMTVALGDYADEDYQIGKQTYFVGSIVGQRNGEDNSRTMFTDVTHYNKILDPILADH